MITITLTRNEAEELLHASFLGVDKLREEAKQLENSAQRLIRKGENKKAEDFSFHAKIANEQLDDIRSVRDKLAHELYK